MHKNKELKKKIKSQSAMTSMHFCCCYGCCYYGDKGPTHILGIELGREHEWSEDEQMAMNSSDSRPNEQNTK